MPSCTVDGCTGAYVARGLCNKHYKRLKRHGSTLPTKGEWGSGGLSHGYRYFSVKRQRIAEHRRVMEQALGRPLRKNEHVHHRNGDKVDNHLENLEIVSPSNHRLRHTKYFRSETHKECAGCHHVLPRSAFTPQAHKYGRAPRDPHVERCRPCRSQYTITHRHQYKSATVASVARKA
jgi:HNH endonuclease